MTLSYLTSSSADNTITPMDTSSSGGTPNDYDYCHESLCASHGSHGDAGYLVTALKYLLVTDGAPGILALLLQLLDQELIEQWRAG